jgi:hypothetical protein
MQRYIPTVKYGNRVRNTGVSNVGVQGIDYVDFEEEVENQTPTQNVYDKLVRQKNQIDNNYNMTDQYMIMGENERNKIRIFKEAQLIQKAFTDKIINYVAGILDPEYNYNTGIMVKQPSLLNPPSVSIPIKTLTTIKSNSSSAICISWNPTLFCTKNEISNIILGQRDGVDVKANRVASVLYSLSENIGTEVAIQADSWDAKVYAIPDNLPEIGVSKARLVSAKIKISFRGSVLNQGGTIMGAATFQGAPGLVLNTDSENRVYKNSKEDEQATWADLFKVTLGDQFDKEALCPFQEKILSNGIWAKNVNITKDANGITAIFIPTDPMDEIFCTPGTYYGEKVAQSQISSLRGATTALMTDKGARLGYMFNIQGLSGSNTNPITVETYATWEVLPTNLSASSLRNSNAGIVNTTKGYEALKDMLSKYMTESSGIHTNKPNQLNGLFDILGRIGKGVAAAFS